MLTVLVVDDDHYLLRLLALILRTAGHFAITAPGPADGLDELCRSTPDLLAFDLNMPVMDGEEFHAEAVQNGYRGPCLVVSGDPGAFMRARRMGVPLLTKPFDQDEFLAAVRSAAMR